MNSASWILRGVFAATLAALFVFTAPALGAPPSHGAENHGEEPATGHEEAGAHGEEHGHHIYYTADDDDDGTPNWRDAQDGMNDEASPEYYVLDDIFWHTMNLAILLGLIVWAVRQPIGDVFRNRERGIRAELTDTARKRDEANQRHQELLARLDKIEGEVETMHADSREAAAGEEAALVQRAEREAQRIAQQATRSIRDEATRAKTSLRREAVELAVKLAEETLRSQVASSDQRALAKDFLDSLQRGA